MSGSPHIGFSQRVRLEWFEETARLVLAGNDQRTINAILQELLREQVSVGGIAKRGTREKIITILLKVWLTVPRDLEALRLDGLELLRCLPPKDHLAVHWGMVSAVYPFWSSVANQVGRLLKLQGTVSATHVQRRIREQFGERETVSRAARRVLRSFIDWGVLQETGKRGIYDLRTSFSIDNKRLAGLLIEAALYGRSNGSATIREVAESPGLFPFDLRSFSANQLVSAAPRIECVRHGMDEVLVILQKQNVD